MKTLRISELPGTMPVVLSEYTIKRKNDCNKVWYQLTMTTLQIIDDLQVALTRYDKLCEVQKRKRQQILDNL